jgi:copper chaperone CopZ
MQKIHLAIEGMSCGHCVARVRRTLEGIEGVHVTSVEVGSADAELDPAATTSEILTRALSEAGFSARVSATRAA